MHIAVKNIKEEDCACEVLILPFVEGGPNPYVRLKPSVSRLVGKVLKKEFKGSLNEVLLVPAPEDIKPERILFLGLGKKEAVTAERIRQAGGKALSCLRDMEMKKTALSTLVFGQLKQSPLHFIEGALLGLYTYKKYKNENHAKAMSSLVLITKPSKDLSLSIRKIEVIASSVAFARDLVNAPANDMTPTDLADAARSLKRKNISVKVLEKKDIQKIGMGAFLAVSYGSKELPKFIVAEYRGSRKPPIVLVGKSITFDSGGLSLKPSEGMEKMKYDMAGGAAVLGVIKAAAELKMPVHLICLLPATENLPGGSAVKPGDVVRSVSGKTIEIANTDAEGRLAVADAIDYAKRFKP
ncbi:MAG: M17 family peptidase N-terminal domain-containing protein, partial [Nitrospirota bacterium]|nr:M17 family peptidase N-terminal domain-containing protein [Nitrospirota bacterium]